jgi:hypothetical protein
MSGKFLDSTGSFYSYLEYLCPHSSTTLYSPHPPHPKNVRVPGKGRMSPEAGYCWKFAHDWHSISLRNFKTIVHERRLLVTSGNLGTIAVFSSSSLNILLQISVLNKEAPSFHGWWVHNESACHITVQPFSYLTSLNRMVYLSFLLPTLSSIFWKNKWINLGTSGSHL